MRYFLNTLIIPLLLLVFYIIWPEIFSGPHSGFFAISMFATQMFKAFEPKPEALPTIPAFKPAPTPPPNKKIEAPSAIPTVDKNSNAFQADEKRRILAAMPTRTKNTFGGDKADETAPIAKKRLLGAGTKGNETTGA